MAAGLLAKHADGRVKVRSAGSAPADEINPAVVAAMAEVDVDLSGRAPQAAHRRVGGGRDVVITMGCGDACPVFPGKRYLDWELDDPSGKSVEESARSGTRSTGGSWRSWTTCCPLIGLDDPPDATSVVRAVAFCFLMARLFGTDGVRGLAGEELTEDLAYGLGRAAVVVLGRHGDGHPTFVVGRDPRASGEWLEDALVEGIRARGRRRAVAGVEPTPAIAFLTIDLGASSGVVISASHNPPEYNGIKFFAPDGMKLPDAIEDEIEAALAGTARCRATVAGRIAADRRRA